LCSFAAKNLHTVENDRESPLTPRTFGAILLRVCLIRGALNESSVALRLFFASITGQLLFVLLRQFVRRPVVSALYYYEAPKGLNPACPTLFRHCITVERVSAVLSQYYCVAR
jgi:hypothetical protein